MSRYEHRFVVDGRRTDDGTIEFTIESDALDDTIWDSEDLEWYRWSDVDGPTQDEDALLLDELEHRLRSPQVNDRETLS